MKRYFGKEIAAAIRDARSYAELTQQQLADRMGTFQPHVSHMESGYAHPTLTTLLRIADATGTKLVVTFEHK